MNLNELSHAGGVALQAALAQRSAKALMSVLNRMDGPTMASALKSAGFDVPAGAAKDGREAVFGAVKADLQRALQVGQAPQRARPGGEDALGLVREVFRAQTVQVVPLGEGALSERASLQLIAAQGLQKGLMGFGIEGVPGKYSLPAATLGELVDLHGSAARSYAQDSTRSALVAWSSGSPARGLSDWVPDSVQRLLQGAVSVDATERVLSALSSDLIGRHAEEQGRGMATALLAEKGLDANAPSVVEQAAEMDLQVLEPDRHRGQFFGAVVGQDHRAVLLKVSRSSALVLTINELGGERPRMGESMRVGFKAGVLSITAKSAERASLSR